MLELDTKKPPARVYAEEGIIGGLLTAAAAAIVSLSIFGPGGGWDAIAVTLGWPADPAYAAYFSTLSGVGKWMAVMAPVVAIVAGLGGFGLGYWCLSEQPDSWHVEGLEYQPDPADFTASLSKAERSNFSDAQVAGDRPGLRIGEVEISRNRETGHFVVVGLPGSGKTTLLNSVLAQALRRRDRVLIHDPKGDYLDTLSAPGGLAAEAIVVLGPWDARSRPWDIARDVAGPAAADQFAKACFPSENAGPNQFFVNSARALLAGIVKHLQQTRGRTWVWSDLSKILLDGPGAILAAAHAGDPLTRTNVPDTEGTGARAVFGELASGTPWITAYARAFAPEAVPFSVADWLTRPTPESPRAVVLNSDARYSGRAEQIFGAILGTAADTIASPAMAEVSPDALAYWMILDEFPQLGTTGQQAAQKIEEMGRSRGVRVVKAMQDASQLFARDGREKGMAQKSMQQTRVFLMSSVDGASDICRALGDREVKRIEFPLTSGQGSKRLVHEKTAVLRVDALTGLRVLKTGPRPGVELILQIGDALGKLVQPFTPMPKGGGQLIENPRWDAVTPFTEPVAAELPPSSAQAVDTSPDTFDEIDIPFALPAPPPAAPAPIDESSSDDDGPDSTTTRRSLWD
ncbi:type IV secretion system DNA-binding domain-containing protein [Silanimonas sp.]|uniref:type IV secretion system DNA-binding domain-containing protein n=1 Tax=Silanimonas sp. TaxID=1929290 RepID=UPI0022C27846|nr:type IV secretion system DNA-binding domain-containing protein [Silanimonas sp.]MCZ8063991.1 type IV secretion system DNA-binding domain-containing protein [Silanimonas sp.]